MTITGCPPTGRFKALFSLSKWLIVCAVLGFAVIRFGRNDLSVRRAVIISSDDAGMCSSVNRGTIKALQAGLVKSVSVMTCCPGFDEFAEFARSNPQYDYGVHLTLTCDLRAAGWGSVLAQSEVPTLIDGEGHFHKTTYEVSREASLTEAERELRAQVEKAINAGITISHLDHHMWVLFARPDFLRLYAKLGREFRLPIRFCREIPRQLSGTESHELTKTYRDVLQELERSSAPILDQIDADNYSVSPAEKRPYFLKGLQSLRPGITEIVIHCASPDVSRIEPPDAFARYADTASFATTEFRDEVLRARIDVINWTQLSDRR